MTPKGTVRRQVIFSVSEYKGSNSVLNMTDFKYSNSKPRTQREVNKGLGRHTSQSPRVSEVVQVGKVISITLTNQ